MISEKDKQYLLSLKPEDITFTCFLELFGNLVDTKVSSTKTIKPRFTEIDEMELRPMDYFVKEKTLTTVGKFIFNKYIIEECGFQDVTGYVNWELTESGLGKLETILDQALLTDTITVDDYIHYIDYRDNLGQQMHSVICPSFTMNVLKTPPEVRRRREQLFKEHADALNKGDLVVATNIEKELLDLAHSLLDGDPGMQLYDSEARGNFKNNYKNNNLLKGPVYNNITGQYDIVLSNLMDGIRKEDLPAYSNAIVMGEYLKAVGTKDSGYIAKKLIALMQSEVLGPKGSDCGSNMTIEMTLPKNTNDFLYRYIVEGGKLVCLTPDVIGKYVGKTIYLRSHMGCTSEKKCNICSGDMFYMEDVVNMGLYSGALAGTLVNACMKTRHDMTVKIHDLDPNSILL